ncbi:MAG: cupin domain-containing protein [Myxococcota bacterium]
MGEIWYNQGMKKANFDADSFHQTDAPHYQAPNDAAASGQHFKAAEGMATVVYEPAHYNPAAGAKSGAGRSTSTWVYGEEAAKPEGRLQSRLEFLIDSELEPGASIGLHAHERTEEIYYLLAGSLTVDLLLADGRTVSHEMRPGDAHLIQPGQRHYAAAGPDGARFIAVAASVAPSKR